MTTKVKNKTNVAHYPLAEVVDDTYPLLKIATENQCPAYNNKIEWLVKSPEGKKAEANYTQIVRTPFVPGHSDLIPEREFYRALERHLKRMEEMLWNGVPFYYTTANHPYTTCGGVRHYLGRDPLVGDQIELRVLRDLVLMKETQAPGLPSVHEFLSETSLMVALAPALT